MKYIRACHNASFFHTDERCCDDVAAGIFFDTRQVGDKEIQRISFELYANTCPKTCANFLHLCKGDKGKTADGIPLHYKGSKFHRVIKNFMLQVSSATSRADPPYGVAPVLTQSALLFVFRSLFFMSTLASRVLALIVTVRFVSVYAPYATKCLGAKKSSRESTNRIP